MSKILGANGQNITLKKGLPENTRFHYDYADRHIFNDQFGKRILIQVMHDYTGALKKSEYEKIKNGLFWEFVPEHLLTHFRDAVEAKYEILPAFINGYNTGNGYIVYQLVPIQEGSPIFAPK